MGLTIQDLLSGDIVKPRVVPQDDSHQALGSMLAFLSQGQNQQAASIPQQPNYAELYRVSPQERAAKQEAEQHAAAVEQMKGLIGDTGSPGNGIPTPYRDAQLPTKGSGLLGGGSLQEFAAKLATSPSPAYASAGVDMIRDSAKPIGPHYITMGVKGQPGYETNARVDGSTVTAIGEPRKSYTGTNIFTGDGMQKRPASNEEKSAWGIPLNEPATMDLKTGEVVGHAVRQPSATEDTNTKFGGGMAAASKRMDDALLNYNIENAPLIDRAGSILEATGLNVANQAANAIKTPEGRQFDQAASEFIQFALPAMTGASYTQDQKDDAFRAMIPTYSDDLVTRRLKSQARADFIKQTKEAGLPMAERGDSTQGGTQGPKSDGTVESDGSKWMSGKRYKLVGDKWHEQRN
jgi:hypothetical protein